MVNTNFAIQYFRRYWAENKAKGLLSELHFLRYLQHQHREIFKPGAWLLSPKLDDSYRYRFAIFVHPDHLPKDPVDNIIQGISAEYLYNRVVYFLRKSGIETLYAIPVFAGEELGEGDDENLHWRIFRLFDGEHKELPSTFFNPWCGRGRPSNRPRQEITENTEAKLRELENGELTSLFLNEAFYTGYLKKKLHVPLVDPYDVDGFFVSYSGAVFPTELKEKSPGGQGAGRFFGIDVGRIIMLLHLCLPSDANALYIIREVDDSPSRRFLGWKYIPLSDLIMAAQWTGQAGGRGMTGGRTQTMLMPYQAFRDFTYHTLSVDSLNSMQNLTAEARARAKEFLDSIEHKYFSKREQNDQHGFTNRPH